MNIDAAIVEVFRSKLFNDFCKRYGKDNHEDLKSEVMVIICEMPEEKKKQIVSNDYLLPFSLQIMRNQVSAKNWTGYRKKYCNRENIHPLFEHFRAINLEFLALDETDLLSDDWYGANSIINEIDGETDILNKAFDKIKQDSLSQDNEFFYHSRVLLETMKYKNVKKTAAAIGIPYKSVRNNLKDYKKALIEWSKSAK